MYARAVEESEGRLRDLGRAQWEGFGLSAFLFASALFASFFHPAFALPLLVGGVTGTVLAARAAYRSWDLLDQLVGEPDAYAPRFALGLWRRRPYNAGTASQSRSGSS